MALPTLDLRLFRSGSAEDKARFVEALGEALAAYGFFYLVGHGVSTKNRHEAMADMVKFFDLPTQAKRSVSSVQSPHVRGFSQLGKERTVGVMDVREVWEMGPDAPPVGREGPPYMRLQGPNLWPAHPTTFKSSIQSMFDQFTDVSTELMRAAALALGQPETYFDAAGYFSDSATAMKLKCCSYPSATEAKAASASNVEAASLGVGPHKDYGFLALIDQDVAGLQVLGRDGEWFSVPLLEGAFVVNGGELLELASMGAFMASTHRVAATGDDLGRARHSLCFFANPSFHAVVEPVPMLPAALAGAAAENRLVRQAAADAGEGRDLYGETPQPYGVNALEGYMRSLPHIFEAHHPDLVRGAKL